MNSREKKTIDKKGLFQALNLEHLPPLAIAVPSYIHWCNTFHAPQHHHSSTIQKLFLPFPGWISFLRNTVSPPPRTQSSRVAWPSNRHRL